MTRRHSSEPDRLILDRAGQPPLSFGGGIHYCLGAPLARLEAQIVPRAADPVPPPVPHRKPAYRDGLALHGPISLPVSAR